MVEKGFAWVDTRHPFIEKSLGTGLEKKLAPKKVSEPVSKNFGTENKYWNQSQNFSEY